MFKKWIALVLCLALLASLWGCGGGEEVTEATTTTEPTTTEEPTTSTEDVIAMFDSAKEALLAADFFTLSIKATEARSVGDETHTLTEAITAKYSGLQGDLLAKISGDRTMSDGYDEETMFYSEEFVNGTVYATYVTAKYQESITAEDYLARQIPAYLFDASNFATATEDRGTALTFTDAVALESWIAPDYAELISAEATASLVDGAFSTLTYEASYRQGAADVTVSYEVSINTTTQVTLSAEAPADADSYIEIDNVEIPRLVDEAMINLLTTYHRSAEIVQVVASEAAGFAAQYTNYTYEYGTGKNYKGMIKETVIQAHQGGQESWETEERLIDGKYTYTVDGELLDEGEVGTMVFSEAVYETIAEYLMDGTYFTKLTPYDVGGGYLIEFEAKNDEIMDYFKEATLAEIFSDTEILDSAASAYKHTALRGYFGIDADTLRLTSYGVEFSGEHTIEGRPYQLTQQINCAYAIHDEAIYHELTDELRPETEPAEKASPVFYHVTGENGEELWLLGSYHVGDEKTAYLPDEIYAAFDASDALAVVYDLNALDEAMDEDEELMAELATLMMYTDGTTVGDYLYGDTYEPAVRALQFYGTYADGIELFKISIWENFINGAKLDGHRSLTNFKSAVRRLLTRAEAAEKEVLSAETPESRVSMVTDLSVELQEYRLKKAIDTPRHEFVAEEEEWYALWCAGNEDAIRAHIQEKMAEEDALMEEYWQAVYTDCNKTLTEAAQEYLSGGKTVFFAVDIANLLSENGIVDSLRAAGYTVELVNYAS